MKDCLISIVLAERASASLQSEQLRWRIHWEGDQQQQDDCPKGCGIGGLWKRQA